MLVGEPFAGPRYVRVDPWIPEFRRTRKAVDLHGTSRAVIPQGLAAPAGFPGPILQQVIPGLERARI